MNKLFGVLQRVGKAFMLPIALLPAAGILLGIGGALLNVAALSNPPAIYSGLIQFVSIPFITVILSVMRDVGDIVFGNLPLLFAIGIAVGLAKSDKGTAGLAGAIGFIIMHRAISTMLALGVTTLGVVTPENLPADLSTYVANTLGIFTLNLSVFGGMIAGIIAAMLHNRFHKIQLPQILGFFGGSRFVPIITSVTMLVVGVFLAFVWPYVQNAVAVVADWVNNSGFIGTWLYGTIERGLIPLGLHHVFYTPFWFTGFVKTNVLLQDGSTILVDGANTAYFAQLTNMGAIVNASKETMSTLVSGTTRFMAGKFPFMMFGLPGAALAMYQTAKPERKKAVGGLLLSAALTAFLTGITEPLEFAFLFVAPVLYVAHTILAGISFLLTDIFDVFIGMTFSGGIIDYSLFGLLPAGAGVPTNWYYVILIGIFYFPIYYFIFKYLIIKFDLKTPGREDDIDATDGGVENVTGSGGLTTLAHHVLTALGGQGNITNLDACITRLRVGVKDIKNVDKKRLQALGASGVLEVGDNVQAIFGGRSDNIKNHMIDIMEGRTPDFDQLPESPIIAQDAPSVPISTCKGSYIKDQLIMPMTGQLIPLSEVPDQVFSQKLMGDGFAINPDKGEVISPVDATVMNVFPTHHAIGLQTNDGLEILIHFGIDTVGLKGEGLTSHVQQGDVIKKGTKLITADLDLIRDKVPSLISPVIFLNLDSTEQVDLKKGHVASGEKYRVWVHKS